MQTSEFISRYEHTNENAGCGHFLMHGSWQCTDCDKWIFIKCEDEWNGLEGVKSKDGKYQYQVIDGKNKIVNIEVEKELK